MKAKRSQSISESTTRHAVAVFERGSEEGPATVVMWTALKNSPAIYASARAIRADFERV